MIQTAIRSEPHPPRYAELQTRNSPRQSRIAVELSGHDAPARQPHPGVGTERDARRQIRLSAWSLAEPAGRYRRPIADGRSSSQSSNSRESRRCRLELRPQYARRMAVLAAGNGCDRLAADGRTDGFRRPTEPVHTQNQVNEPTD